MSRGGHGAYVRHWLCVTCRFAIPANRWRRHRAFCLRRKGTRCPLCNDWFPCRKEACPNVEKPKEVSALSAPTPGVVKSLHMKVEQLADGRWSIRAAWLDGPVIGDTWPEAYWAALRVK